MRIGIDIQGLQTQATRNRGIGRYIHSTIEALFNQKSEHSFHLYANNMLSNPVIDSDFLSYQYIDFNLVKSKLISDDVDAIFIPNPMEGDDIVMPDYRNFCKPVFVICYDLIPLVFSDRYLVNPERRKFYMKGLENIRNADCILAISEATRQDTIRLLDVSPDKVVNIKAGISPLFTPVLKIKHSYWLKIFADKFKITKKFILYTGGEDWRKNIEGLVKAFAKLPQNLIKEYQLVIACRVSKNFSERLTELAKTMNIEQSLVLTNYVTDEELRALYSTCSLFVFPSFYEGFGLPLVEAMACGAPAIASNSSSLVEIISDSNLLFDPQSTEDITKHIQEVLSDQAWRKEISAKGLESSKQFSWQAIASKISESFRKYKLLDRFSISFERIKKTESKTKVAFFSPFRPIKSGISDYSHELLPFLAHHCELDLYFDEGYSPDTTDLNQTVLPWNQFEERVTKEDYENIIYHMGNSVYHCYAYSQLMNYPGISVLHDYYLGGLIKGLHYQRPELGFTLLEELKHNYGTNKATEIFNLIEKGDLDTCDKLASVGIYLNRRIFTRSLGVVVHSKWAYNKALKEFGNDNSNIIHIPMLMSAFKTEESSSEVRNQLNIPQDKFVISTLGIVANTKRAIPIIQAFKKYISEHPNSMLVYVGNSAPVHDVLTQEINRLGLVDKVRVTGHVSMTDFYNYIQISDVCLNLRYPSNGESSASLMRILSAGKPVVVTDIGSFADFPDNVVLKIPQPTECDEVKEIFRALVLLTENEQYRRDLGFNAYDYVAKEHAPEKCALLYAEFIQQVLKSNESRRKLLDAYIRREAGNLSSNLTNNGSTFTRNNGISIGEKGDQASTGMSRQKYLKLNSELKWSENKSKAWKEVAKQFQVELKNLNSNFS